MMLITVMIIMTARYSMAENWVMVVSEMHRYQGVSYKSDIIVISGLDIVSNILFVIINTNLILTLTRS